MIILWLTRFLLLARQILENHFTDLLVINQVLVSNVVIPIRMLPNPNLLVKTKVTMQDNYCNYCKQSGHIVSEKQEGLKPTGLTSLKLTPHSCVMDQTHVQAKVPETNSVMEIYEPFLSDGFVSLNSDFAQSTPITILRDTGASQSLILADTLPFSEKTSSGTSVLVQGVECGFVNVPLHDIYLSSDLVNGPVAVGIRQSLPFKGVHLLLGNDLAGGKVVVNPLVTDTPCIDQSPDPIEQELPDLYPSCAVTRAMAKKAMLTENQSDIDLTDSFIGQSFKM